MSTKTPGRWSGLLGASVLVFAAVACSDWPGLNDKPNGTAPLVGPTTDGTCSGTPEPCSTLTTADCGTTPGCTDNGTCGGQASTIGETCGTQFSPQSCNGNPGCFWATNCTGTPYGTCSAITEQACLIAPGCVWTSLGTGSPGAGGTGGAACTTFGVACSSSAQCDCGYDCVLQCSGCSATCGRACQVDTDCTGSTGTLGLPTLHCLKTSANLAPPYSGICSN